MNIHTTPQPYGAKPHILSAIQQSPSPDIAIPNTPVGLVAICTTCRKIHAINTTFSAWISWTRGDFIQNAMSELTDDERELLISGTCGSCFDKFADANDIIGDYFDNKGV